MCRNALLLFSLLFFSAHAWAADVALDKLKSVTESALEIVYGDCCKDLSSAEKQRQVRDLLEEHFDLTILIRRAMGRNWNLLSESEQKRVHDLVEQLVVKAYVQGLEGTERPEITFHSVVKVSNNRIEIPSTVRLDNKNVSLLYRMGRMRSGWEIFDIVAENISIVSNYRQQFDDHFRRGSGAELIEKLEKLLEQESLDGTIEL